MNGLDVIKQTLCEIEKKYGVYIVIKDLYSTMQMRPELKELLNRFYAHENEYCKYIKSNHSAMNECRRSEHTGIGRTMNSEANSFVDGKCVVCSFGVKEFYFPIKCTEHTIGALVVGCSPCEDKVFESVQEKAVTDFSISKEEMKKKYNLFISNCTIPNSPEMFREIALCGNLLSLTCEKLLANINIDRLFFNGIILDESNVYLDAVRRRRIISKTKSGENRRMTVILNAIFYIQDNYASKISIDDIAKYCYCSSSTLSHIFAKNYGMTIGNLIHTVRCDRAKILLSERTMTVEQAALACGFSSPDYFTSIFKSLTGQTPSEYRGKRMFRN